MAPKSFIFYDNSNIFLSGRDVAGRLEGLEARPRFRIYLEALVDLAAGGREIGGAWAAGSESAASSGVVWQALQDQGIHVEVFERGALTGSEQAVDQSLQVHMLRQGYEQPQVAVLISGDGAGHEEGRGFLNDLKLMKRSGWGVEVLAWEQNCSRAMRDWVAKNGVFIPLERYYDQVTFLEFRRNATPLDLSSRPLAKPDIPEYQRAFEAGKQVAAERIRDLETQLEMLRAKTEKTERYNNKIRNRSKV
jgi:hypothetical protein